MTLEAVPHAGRCQVDAEDRELRVDPTVAPRRVLPGQAHDQLHRPLGDPRATREVRVGPLAPDQRTMPPEQGVGLDKESGELCSGEQSAEAGQEGSICWLQSGAGHLTTEDGHLVAEHDDLDRQIGVTGPLKSDDLDGPEEGEIEEREGHGPFSQPSLPWRKSQLNVADEVLGTHTKLRLDTAIFPVREALSADARLSSQVVNRCIEAESRVT